MRLGMLAGAPGLAADDEKRAVPGAERFGKDGDEFRDRFVPVFEPIVPSPEIEKSRQTRGQPG